MLLCLELFPRHGEPFYHHRNDPSRLETALPAAGRRAVPCGGTAVRHNLAEHAQWWPARSCPDQRFGLAWSAGGGVSVLSLLRGFLCGREQLSDPIPIYDLLGQGPNTATLPIIANVTKECTERKAYANHERWECNEVKERTKRPECQPTKPSRAGELQKGVSLGVIALPILEYPALESCELHA